MKNLLLTRLSYGIGNIDNVDCCVSYLVLYDNTLGLIFGNTPVIISVKKFQSKQKWRNGAGWHQAGQGMLAPTVFGSGFVLKSWLEIEKRWQS
jgi:hypothetical protein